MTRKKKAEREADELASLQLAHGLLKDEHAGLQLRHEEASQRIWEAESRLQQQASQIAVLSSDRDRLTATVESLARRLASPTAETDRTRAGWRHANEQQAAAVEKLYQQGRR